MTRTATASVCIVTYNSESDIERCLQAVLRQSHPIERVIVIDNASSDRTCEVVRRFDSPVQLIANRENNGFAGGQNQAIGQTDSDYVLVLNPDVELHPDYLTIIIDHMERHPRIGSATGQLVLASDPGIIDSTGIEMGNSRKAWDRGAGEAASGWSRSGDVFGVSGAASVYARRMIEDIKMDGQFYDEAFFAYKEDVDVAWRARQLGWQAYYAAEARATHERGWKYTGRKGRKRIPLFLRKLSYRNRLFMIIKNEPGGWKLLATLPRLLGLELLQLGYVTIFEPGLLKCWVELIRAFPRLLRQRKKLNGQIARIK
ncbi:glycosyltransferase family 2 protein [Paenibacillus oenotherae]|uniref:Glycosyltransferase family 2 protein n=1 Tax=Paenibacillus oenotherae TaxID=1435645 RepID=A0ABS7D5E0_9BACL|nr:glycosyltransferase family 2 protein [Paenibacillus oenotherae]MBW7475046.1 glycosyltransferase family 2 protein [Paenibacillus oenotherae]